MAGSSCFHGSAGSFLGMTSRLPRLFHGSLAIIYINLGMSSTCALFGGYLWSWQLTTHDKALEPQDKLKIHMTNKFSVNRLVIMAISKSWPTGYKPRKKTIPPWCVSKRTWGKLTKSFTHRSDDFIWGCWFMLILHKGAPNHLCWIIYSNPSIGELSQSLS